MFVDPSRKARHAIRDGKFRAAKTALDCVEAEHRSAEWHLLSAMAAWRLGSFQKSLQHATVSLDEYRKLADTDGEMRAQNVAAAGSFALGALSMARRGYTRALFLAQQRHDLLMIARCTNNLGSVCYYLKQNTNAMTWYRRAARGFEQVGFVPEIARAWHNIGVVLREENLLREALAATDRALDAAQRLGDRRCVGWALGGRGETNIMLRDLRLGEAEVVRALELSREQEDRLTEIEALRALSLVARLEGDRDRSLGLVRQAVALSDQVQSKWLIAQSNRDFARVLQELHRGDEARDAIDRAVVAYTELGAEDRSVMARREFES